MNVDFCWYVEDDEGIGKDEDNVVVDDSNWGKIEELEEAVGAFLN